MTLTDKPDFLAGFPWISPPGAHAGGAIMPRTKLPESCRTLSDRKANADTQEEERFIELLMEQAEIPREDQEWCSKLEDLWEREYQITESLRQLRTGACPDTVSYQRRIEELEDRRKLIEEEYHALLKQDAGHGQTAIKPFPCGDSVSWEQITFILKTDDLVYVRTPLGEGRFLYSDLAFADSRKGDAPNTTTWPLFQVLAKMNGEVELKGQEYDRQLPDRARLLNKHLKALFHIKESIWTDHYKKRKSYRARFTIRDQRDK
jgi:hypothetical protein